MLPAADCVVWRGMAHHCRSLLRVVFIQCLVRILNSQNISTVTIGHFTDVVDRLYYVANHNEAAYQTDGIRESVEIKDRWAVVVEQVACASFDRLAARVIMIKEFAHQIALVCMTSGYIVVFRRSGSRPNKNRNTSALIESP